MKKVLLFTYLQRHFKKMLPIIKEIEKQQHINLTVVIMTEEERELAIKNGVSFKMLDEYTDAERHYDYDPGWGLEPLINAIDTVQPDLFIAIEVNSILRNAVRYCKQIKIPTFIIQHGTPNKYSIHAFAPFEGDCFAAWGQFTKDILVAANVDSEKIVLTGGIPFDRIGKFPEKTKIAEELNIEPEKKWVIFTTQPVGAGNRPSEEEIFTGITEIIKCMSNKQNFKLILQVHPSQSIESVLEIANSVEGHDVLVTRYPDTESLISVSDGVITFFSTTALDAILMEIPLLLINLTDDKDFFPFVSMGAAFGAYTTEEISPSLENLLTKSEMLKPNYVKCQTYINYMNDGKALERVMEICYRMLKL